MENLYKKYPSHFHFIAFFAVAVFTTSFLLNQISIHTENQYAAAAGAVAQGASTGPKDPAKFVAGQIIVQFKAGVSKAAHDKTLSGLGLVVKKTIDPIRAEVISVPVGAEKKVRDALAHNPQIQYAELDGLVDASFTPNDPNWSKLWELQDGNGGIHMQTAWDVAKGSGQTIAILDSGQDGTHPDLAANMVAGYNFIANNSNTSADPSCPHGTAVAGTAAAVGNNATGTVGTAFAAKIMPLVIADSAHTQCAGSWSAIASAYTYAADHGVRVINISYGGDVQSSTEQNAANYAWSKGAIIFAAAGNSGGGTNPVQYPAADQNVVAVAGTDPYGNYATFSEYGNYIDIAAPATFYTTDQAGTSGFTAGDYINISGTSFSSPIAAGVAALMLSSNPTLTNSQIVSLMEQTADDEGDPGWDVHYGWGKINAARALIAASATTTYTDTVAPTGSMRIQAKMPINNASYASGVTNIIVIASDNIGVSKVELYKDGTLYATTNVGPYNYYWDTSTEVNGSQHTFYAKLYDAAGNVATTSSAAVTVDNTTPTVTITSPLDGATVSGIVSLAATAADAISQPVVYWQIDGANLTGSQWDTTSTTNGAHVITAQAYDKASNLATTTITVTVNNIGGTTDTQAPSTNVGTPANGATVSGTTNVLASAGDNVGVVKLELYKDGALINSIAASTMSYAWDTTRDSNGTHTLQTKAYDAAGNVGISPINSVNVSNQISDTQAPTTSVTTPASGATVSGSVNVAGSASDNVAVTKIELYKDGVLASSANAASISYAWDTTKDSNGTHYLMTKAYDAAGNVGTSMQISVTVQNQVTDTTAPVTSITAPANSAVLSGAVPVSATASDNVAVSKVEFYLDGAFVASDTASPYGWGWDTTLYANGIHSLITKAYDAAGNIGTSPTVSVDVENAGTNTSDTTPPAVTITSPANGSALKGTNTKINVSASDASGIATILISIDGVSVKTCSAATLCTYTWQLKSVAPGSHVISAIVTDASSNHNQGTASVTVTK